MRQYGSWLEFEIYPKQLKLSTQNIVHVPWTPTFASNLSRLSYSRTHLWHCHERKEEVSIGSTISIQSFVGVCSTKVGHHWTIPPFSYGITFWKGVAFSYVPDVLCLLKGKWKSSAYEGKAQGNIANLHHNAMYRSNIFNKENGWKEATKKAASSCDNCRKGYVCWTGLLVWWSSIHNSPYVQVEYALFMCSCFCFCFDACAYIRLSKLKIGWHEYRPVYNSYVSIHILEYQIILKPTQGWTRTWANFRII